MDSKIIIQEILKDDQTEFFELIDKNRKDLRQYLTWIDMTNTESDLDNWFKKGKELHPEKEGCNYKILADDSIIGFIGVFINDVENRVFEFGYWLDVDLRGKGVMSSIIPGIEKICFNDFEASKVEIRCATGNIGSNKVAIKNGYTFEKVIENYREIAGIELDYNVYGKKHE